MSSVAMQDLLEAGFHFGHQTQRWNPKMKPFIYGEKNGVHIINLSKTVPMMNKALEKVQEVVANGKDLLFVGTKRQAQDIVAEQAQRCQMHFINLRWMGGTLTNFKTVKASINRLKKLEEGKADGAFESFKKNERLMIDREIARLEKPLSGIKNLVKTPGLVVLIDPQLEHLALKEAQKLNVPVIALTDTNCNPVEIDYVVPGNDDALKAIKLFCTKVADAVLVGLELRQAKALSEAKKKEEEKKEQVGDRVVEMDGQKTESFVNKPEEDDGDFQGGSYSARPESAQEKKEEA